MSISFVSLQDVLAETAAGTAHVYQPTTTIAAGRLAVLTFCCSGAPSFAVADSVGNSWSFVASNPNGTTEKVGIAACVVTTQITATDSITVTTGTNQSASGLLMEFSGNETASPADQTATNTGTGTAYSVGPTATLSQADELLVAGFGWNGNATQGTFTPGAGLTDPNGASVRSDQAGSFIRYCGTLYQVLNSTSGPSASATGNNSTAAWCACAVTFKAKAAPAGTSGLFDLDIHPLGWF